MFELWAWKASSWVENSHYPDGWREPCLKGCNATVLIEVGIIVFLTGIIVRTHILIHRNLGWGAYCRFYPLHYADARRETSSMGCWSESSCNYAGLSLVNWTFNRSIPYSNSLSLTLLHSRWADSVESRHNLWGFLPSWFDLELFPFNEYVKIFCHSRQMVTVNCFCRGKRRRDKERDFSFQYWVNLNIGAPKSLLSIGHKL